MEIKFEHNGIAYTGQIGTIRSTSLGYEDHGIFTAMLYFDLQGSSSVSVGGYALDSYNDGTKQREGSGYGLDHIIRIIETVGVADWEALRGTNAIVLFGGDGGWGERAVGIAGITNGKVLILSEHAAEWKLRRAVGAEA